MKKEITKVCPNCDTPYKKTEKCRICEKHCCNLCSLDYLCIDCWLKDNQIKEIRLYKFDKIAIT